MAKGGAGRGKKKERGLLPKENFTSAGQDLHEKTIWKFFNNQVWRENVTNGHHPNWGGRRKTSFEKKRCTHCSCVPQNNCGSVGNTFLACAVRLLDLDFYFPGVASGCSQDPYLCLEVANRFYGESLAEQRALFLVCFHLEVPDHRIMSARKYADVWTLKSEKSITIVIVITTTNNRFCSTSKSQVSNYTRLVVVNSSVSVRAWVQRATTAIVQWLSSCGRDGITIHYRWNPCFETDLPR